MELHFTHSFAAACPSSFGGGRNMYRRQTDWHFIAPYPLAPSYLIPWGGVHHYLYQFPPPSLLCLAASREGPPS